MTKLLSLICLVLLIDGMYLPASALDKELLYVIGAYTDSLKRINEKALPGYFNLIRIEEIAGERRIYISAGLFSSTFLAGIPDSASNVLGKQIFWYTTKRKPDSKAAARPFFKKFGYLFVNDLKNDYTDRHDYVPEYSSYYEFVSVPFLYVFRENLLVLNRRICRFPSSRFYDEGLTFDNQGNLMYEDGVYHTCNLDPGSPLVDYEFGEYFQDQGVMGLRSEDRLTAELTIDEMGNIKRASVKPVSRLLSAKVLKDVERALLTLPPWRPATVSGRRVKYRTQIVLM